jgi:hypothetical protein
MSVSKVVCSITVRKGFEVFWAATVQIVVFWVLKIEAAGSFKLLVSTYKTVRCHDPEDHNLITYLFEKARLQV